MKKSTLKRYFLGLLFCLAVICFPIASHALNIEDVPNPRVEYGGWVTDMADLLSAETESKLNQTISDLEAKNGTEIAVVTVQETSPSPTPKDFTTTLFNTWGIGKAEQDNGVLFLVSKGDRRVEIETGYGIEPILPDAKVGDIINTEITPKYKQGDFDGGTIAGVNALVSALGSEVVAQVPQDSVPVTSHKSVQLLFSGVLAILAIVFSGVATHFNPKVLLVSGSKSRINPKKKNIDFSLNTTVLAILAPFTGAVALSLLAIALFPPALTYIAIFAIIFITILFSNWFLKHLHQQRVLCDAQTQKPMTKLDSDTLSNHLTKAEKVAQKAGSVRYEGWQIENQPPHIRAYILNNTDFTECPHCQELTVTRTTKILKNATYDSRGSKLITHECLCCDYRTEQKATIPRKVRSYSSSSSSYSSYSGGSYGGGGYSGGSSGGGSSGGSSFGGGDSGGGGAGGGF